MTIDRTEIQDDDEREDARRLSLQGTQPPAEIDGYSFIRLLGTGAYGTVWLAREDRTGRMVAVKYYPHRRGLNWSLLNREVEKLATLYSSRNIVRLLDVGWNAEPPYYVMEYVENGSLGEHLAAGPLSVDETVRIAEQICRALVEAHGAGVLHCDLKPDNVLLDVQFQVRLCDFGQSRMSHEQSPALGTLYYMAPEQAGLESDAIPDARWDVYAVGALMFHMLTGEPPFRETAIQRRLEQAHGLQDRLEIYRQHLRDAPAVERHHRIRGVDKQLASLIDECLAIEPADRLPNAQVVLDRLETRQRNRSRRPLLLLGVVGPLLLIAAMIPIFVRGLHRNIVEMETELVERDEIRNAMLARSQANSLSGELLSRLNQLSTIVARGDVLPVLEDVLSRPSDQVVTELRRTHDLPMSERPEWVQVLDNEREIVDQWMEQQGKSKDVSWCLWDASGRQLWRRNYADTVGQTWAFRDYFHGRNIEYDEFEVPDDISPIQSPHVSLPFRSRATNKYMVALTVPVKDSTGHVTGVFGRTLHLGDLQRQLGRNILGDNASDTLIALADTRQYQLLDHPWLKDDELSLLDKDQTDAIFDQLKLDQYTVERIEQQLATSDSTRQVDLLIDSYKDPVGHLDDRFQDDWVAAISTMKSKKMPWLVIVQADKNATLAPVTRMEQRAIQQVIYAVLASVLTMAAIWLFVWHAVTRSQSASRQQNTRIGQKPVADN